MTPSPPFRPQSTESLRSVAFAEKIDVVVSCLASRTGGIQARGPAPPPPPPLPLNLRTVSPNTRPTPRRLRRLDSHRAQPPPQTPATGLVGH